jgi:hypothetical protein
MRTVTNSPAAERACSGRLREALSRGTGLCAGLAFMAFSWLTASAAEPSLAAHPKIALRVIYFGHPQTPRAKDFVELLEQHFAKVGQGDLDTFGESDAAGYDVTILDYDELKVVNDRIESPKKIVSRQYPHPTITIGATGALVCDRLRLKTGYL